MVQRDVGDRLAAAPRGKLYGVTSVLAQDSPSPARSASCAACRATSSTEAERGVGADPAQAARLGGRLRHHRPGPRRLRPPAQGPRRLARPGAGRGGRPARPAPGRRSRSSATRPMPAPSVSPKTGPTRRRDRPRAARLARPAVIAERAYARSISCCTPGRRAAEDGLHPLCSLFASLALADHLAVEVQYDEARLPRSGGGQPRHRRSARDTGGRARRRSRLCGSGSTSAYPWRPALAADADAAAVLGPRTKCGRKPARLRGPPRPRRRHRLRRAQPGRAGARPA